LVNVEALANLRSVVLIEFLGNPALETLSLPRVERVEVYVNVANNPALTSLELPSLLTTGGIFARMNPVLTSVIAPELSLSGATAFEQNSSLVQLSLPKLAYVSGDLDLTNSGQLSQISFPSLVAVGGRLVLNQLPKFTSFTGLGELSSIGGYFTVQSCNALQNFVGLGALVEAANVTVSRNAVLTDFEGLDSFEKVGGDLTISMNPSLPLVSAQDFADSLTIGGLVSIN
jgi:hypothetical protein